MGLASQACAFASTRDKHLRLGFYMGYARRGRAPEPIAMAQEAERLGYDPRGPPKPGERTV